VALLLNVGIDFEKRRVLGWSFQVVGAAKQKISTTTIWCANDVWVCDVYRKSVWHFIIIIISSSSIELYG